MIVGNKAQAACRRVDDALPVHRSAIAMVDEKSVIHPTSAYALLLPLHIGFRRNITYSGEATAKRALTPRLAALARKAA